MTLIRRALTGSAEHPVLTFDRNYRATPAELRHALTRTDRLAGWFGQIEGSPAGVGDSFTAQLSEDPADRASGTVLRCDPEVIAVSWSWKGEATSVITASLIVRDPEHTTLRLHHELAEPQHLAGYGGGWEQVLQSLSRALGDADPAAIADDRIEADAVQRWRIIGAAPLDLEHTVAAPIEQVWEAFTTVRGLQSWWWSHWDDVQIEADAQEGGVFRIQAPGAGVHLSGSYLAVQRPNHLSYTWQWQDADGEVADEAVDIQFESTSEGTLIHIRHSGPWDNAQPAENYRQGWRFTLQQLADSLAV